MPRLSLLAAHKIHSPSEGDKNLQAFALALCASYTRIPDVNPPFSAHTLTWSGEEFIYVHGFDHKGQKRLLEVFKPIGNALEALHAFQYPPPFRKLFREDYDVLYSDDPWGDKDQAEEEAG